MFNRNSQYGVRKENMPNPAETDTSITAFFSRGGGGGGNNNVKETRGRQPTKKSRPHSWHSTIQKGLARARSRSMGRDKEKDKLKRASAALTHGKYFIFQLLKKSIY